MFPKVSLGLFTIPFELHSAVQDLWSLRASTMERIDRHRRQQGPRFGDSFAYPVTCQRSLSRCACESFPFQDRRPGVPEWVAAVYRTTMLTCAE